MTTVAGYATLSTYDRRMGKLSAAAAEHFADGPLYTFDNAPMGEPLSDEEHTLLEEAEAGIRAGRTGPTTWYKPYRPPDARRR